MAGLINNASALIASAIDWMGQYVTAISATGNELLLLFTILPLVGLGIGLIKRMISM